MYFDRYIILHIKIKLKRESKRRISRVQDGAGLDEGKGGLGKAAPSQSHGRFWQGPALLSG